MKDIAEIKEVLLGVDRSEGLKVGLGALLLFAILYPTIKAIYGIYFHPLSKFPGPRFNAASDIPLNWQGLFGRLIPYTQELHRQYGEIVRVSPNQLSFITPSAWKDIYMLKAGRPQMPKLAYAEPLQRTQCLVDADQPNHDRQRKLLSHAFSDKAMRAQEPLLLGYVNLLIQKLSEACETGSGVVDLKEWYNYTTFDIVSDLCFGESFHNLESSDSHPWIKSVLSSTKLRAIILHLRPFNPFRNMMHLLMTKSMKQKFEETVSFTGDKCKARQAKDIERPDFMSYILRNNDEKGISQDEIEGIMTLLIIGGSETTATLLTGLTYLLLHNPATLHRLTTTVREAFASSDQISVARINELPYVWAVIQEGLRMYPPVPIAQCRIVPPGGETISGHWVPGGTEVGIPHYAAYHSPENFVYPDTFIPERWMQVKEAPYAEDRKAMLEPFSAGPRNCIAKNLAYSELKLILTKMVWHFDMDLVDKRGDWLDQQCYVLFVKPPMKVKLTARAS